MNWQEFEDRLKAEAHQHPTPVDTDALWAKIQEKKRRRWLPFFWLLAGFGLLGAGGWWYAAQQARLECGESINTIWVQPESGVDKYGKTISDPRSIDRAEGALAGPDKTGHLMPENGWKAGNQPGERPKNIHLRNPINQHSPAKAALTTHIPVVKSRGSFVAASTNFIAAENSSKLSEIRQNSRSTTTGDLKQTSIAPGSDPVSTITSPTPPLPFLLHPFIWLPETRLQPILSSVATSKSPAPQKSRQVYVGWSGGLNIWNIHRDGLGSSGTYPRSHEKTISAWQIGLQAQIPINRSWSVRTGILYTEYQSVFRWANHWEVADSTSPVLSYFVNGNIDTGYTVRLFRYDRAVQHYNRLQSLAIPLDLQRSFSLGKLTLKPALGLQIQFWQKGKGWILKDGEPDDAAFGIIYKPALNLGLRFGLSLEVPLGPKTRIFLEPAGSLDLLSRTQKDYPAERFRQWGLQIGILRQW